MVIVATENSQGVNISCFGPFLKQSHHLFYHFHPHFSEKLTFVSTPSVDYIYYQWGDKLRVSDTQSVGRWLGEVHMKLLWAVCAGAGTGKGKGKTLSLSATLHGEGGLAAAINAWVDAFVFCWSGAH